jgi:acetyl-CoA acetyltransferase
VFNTVKEGSAWNHQTRKIRPTAAKGQSAWLLPVGAFATANIFALYAKRYMHEYGLTREQLGWIPVVQRAHAVRNPDAIYQEPLGIEDYLQARMISEPFCLYDCDPPVDASTAFVVSAIDTVPDLRSPVHIEAMAMISASRASFDLSGDLTRMAAHDAATELWSRTDLTPQDIDVAQLYDGHSFFALMWLEALGLCTRGEAGDFVEGGKRITYGGDIPINTWGGHLSGGRLHAGFGHLAEAVRQVRGEADLRQVRDVETAAITVGAGPAAACALLSRRAAE